MARTVVELPEPNEEKGQEADSGIRYLQTDSIVFQGSMTPHDVDFVRLDVAAGDTISVRVLDMPSSSYKAISLYANFTSRVVNQAVGVGASVPPIKFLAPNTQTYFVGVYREGPGTIPYSVAIDVKSNFNALEYIASYPDLMAAFGANPEAGQQHFLASGGREGRKATFSAAEYIASYGDLTKAFGADINAGAKHYIENGVREGRSVTFIGQEYIASYDDLIQAFQDDARAGASHYLQQGRMEGRQVSFDGLEYIASYDDLISAFGPNSDLGSKHYIQGGKLAEGRKVSFDPVSYVSQYADLRAAFGDDLDAATEHYIRFGRAEGRTREATLRMGTDSPESLTGGSSADKLVGLGGNDTLVGGAGDDVLDGGQGSDWMSGGAGADRYILGGGRDTISGFNPSEGDKIALDNAVFPALGTEGTLPVQFLFNGDPYAPYRDSNDFLVYRAFTGELYYDSDGSGPNGPIQIAYIEPFPGVMQSADFLVV